MSYVSPYEAMFSGAMGKEYQMLFLVCPVAAKMSQLVAQTVADYTLTNAGKIKVVELGGGTGITTHAILSATTHTVVISIDNEPTMQAQAKHNLHQWVENGRLVFSSDDALTALQRLDSASVEVIASAYTLHNFTDTYRAQVISEIFRVLKSGGLFVNGDRYALDDVSAHTLAIQTEVTGYFKVFIEQKRLDLLEQWIVHLFSDESENHLMRESFSLQQLAQAGFTQINLSQREEVNALVTAVKP